MRSHHKPVLEVEREVYCDFNSNRAEGQKAFESRQLEFPKVLSLTIIINVLWFMLMNTHAYKITWLLFFIYVTSLPKGKGKGKGKGKVKGKVKGKGKGKGKVKGKGKGKVKGKGKGKGKVKGKGKGKVKSKGKGKVEGKGKGKFKGKGKGKGKGHARTDHGGPEGE
jgi:hypothetical protein